MTTNTKLHKNTVAAFLLFCLHTTSLHTMETSKNQSPLTISLGLDKTPTDLHYAAQEGNIVKINSLLNDGADINSTECHYHNTPIHIATWFGHHDCVSLLIKREAKLTITNCYGSTPVHSAAWKNELSCLTELIKHGAPIGIKNTTGTGNTELYLAAKAGSTECLRALLQYNNNKEYIDLTCSGDNSTAIQAAAAGQRAQCYWDLVIAGANYTKQIVYKNRLINNSDMIDNNKPLKTFVQNIERYGKDIRPRFKNNHILCFLCTQNFKNNDVVTTIKLCSHSVHAHCFENYCVHYFMEKNKTEPWMITTKKDHSDKEFVHNLKTNSLARVKLANECPQCIKIFDPQQSLEFSVFLDK